MTLKTEGPSLAYGMAQCQPEPRHTPALPVSLREEQSALNIHIHKPARGAITYDAKANKMFISGQSISKN